MKQYRDIREAVRLMRRIDRMAPVSRHYIMRPDGSLRPASSLHFMMWAKAGNTRVGRTYVLNGKVQVSTVFLGSDHNPLSNVRLRGFSVPRPHLFETMVFGLHSNGLTIGSRKRYATRDEAVLGHLEISERINEIRWPPKVK